MLILIVEVDMIIKGTREKNTSGLIPIIESCYKTSRKCTHRAIFNRIILRCRQKGVRFVEYGQEVYVKKEDMEKVVTLNKLSHFLFGASIREILEKNNITITAYRRRIGRGWGFEKALTKRMQRQRRKRRNMSREN